MPLNNITINRGTQPGNELLSVIVQLRDAQSKLSQIKQQMDNMTDGADYTRIEALFGVPAGKGQSTYNLVAGADAGLAGLTDFNQLIDWFGPLF